MKVLGLKALRLDYGFDDWKLLERLQQDFILFINASTVNSQYIHDAENHGLNLGKLHAAHNFYPKPETGLSRKYFMDLNSRLVDAGIKVLAFVPGDLLKRYPFYQGLPTLEFQRGQNPYVSAVQLINDFGVDDILCGDSKIRLSTLTMINNYEKTRTMTLPIIDVGMPPDLYHGRVKVRKEVTDKLVRLNVSRQPNVEIEETGNRIPGTITQDNFLAERYSGEIQISKVSLPFTEKSNIIGYVHPAYLNLLQYIDGDTTLQFVKA